MRPLSTVISSGGTETYDHPNPRPTIVAASAIAGRRLIEGDILFAPLIYMTEVARRMDLKKIGSLAEFRDPEEWPYVRNRPTGVEKHHNTQDEQKMFRLFLGSTQLSSFDWPRLDQAKVVRSIRYGLTNFRTDGKRLFFAQKKESGDD
jgi:hypothetical protein